jgi:hypothetical protein
MSETSLMVYHRQTVKQNFISFQEAKVFLFFISWGGVRLSPLGTAANICPSIPAQENRR